VAALCVGAAAVLLFWHGVEEVLARNGDAVTVTVKKTGPVPRALLVGSPGVCVTITAIVGRDGVDVPFADKEELHLASAGEVATGSAIEVSMIDSDSGELTMTVTSIVYA